MDLQSSAALLDFITQLSQRRPFRHKDIAAATGHTLRIDAASSNPYFAIYQSAGAVGSPGSGHAGDSAAGAVAAKTGVITAVELREPRGKDPDPGGLLILQLGPPGGDKPCVTQKEVQARFGKSPALSVPTPHQPADAPLYLVYTQDWGQLRFGFARNGSECLVTVVLDAIKG